MREQLAIGSRLSWIVALTCAVIAPAIYVFWPSTLTWWVGLALLVPIVGLTLWRQEKKGYDDPAVGDGGPWGPPPL